MIRKTKDRYCWKTGFAFFGAKLDDGYSIFFRRFNYRELPMRRRMESCRFGMTAEYEAVSASRQKRIRPQAPMPYTRRKGDNNES